MRRSLAILALFIASLVAIDRGNHLMYDHVPMDTLTSVLTDVDASGEMPSRPPSLMRLIETPMEAQSNFFGFHRTFAAQTAVGATASSGTIRGIVVNHTAELIVTGAPATCTYRLQGTRDAVTWFNLSAADVTCTTTTVAFEANKPAVQVRGNLVTLTGGTAPTVTLKYVGR